MRRIRSILVANRGEIALRVIRTCKEMNIRAIAVYSEFDSGSPHVRLADESYCIGPPPALQSYLRMEAIVEAAKKSGADAVHPGYGFLSENAKFAEILEKNGLIFIGPPAAAMRAMGDKIAARKLALASGIPVVPGTTEPLESISAKSAARKVGYPVMLKAAGGGGGKGMRLVRSEEEFDSCFRSSQSEVRSAFDDDRIYVEKYIEKPRHVEVQVLADSEGNVIHLGERECSVQRRHQKIIEESPSVALSGDQREQITRSAITLARSSTYRNAGTLEFILGEDGTPYFLEMNTRLQVEHPVTEMRAGIDIVREQIRIAEGNRLSLKQSDVHLTGHAIECRIYAEDSSFLPSTGTIVHLTTPGGFGIRVDSGIEQGIEIPTHYDPLMSKLIVWGSSREEAVARMTSALDSLEILGVAHNAGLCHWVLSHKLFREGKYDTGFLDEHFKGLSFPEDMVQNAVIASILTERMPGNRQNSHRRPSKWKSQIRE